MKGRNALLAAALFSLIASRAKATTFSELVSFGDSLSDNGNASIATLGAEPGAGYAYRTYPGVPFQVGEFTDGPSTTPASASPTGLWNEQLAAKLGLPQLNPVLAGGGGTNYSVAGATTGTDGVGDMQDQVNLFLSNYPSAAPSTALYTFWGGANDITAGDNPTQAADNIYDEIKQVASDGGKYFLWPNLPQLGDTPEGAADASALNAASTAFNAEWSVDLAALLANGVDVVPVDVNTLFNNMLTDPSNYGFTNVTSPAQNVSGANPNQYLFWDGLHPTTEADMYVANLAAADLTASVPEPASGERALIIGAGCLARRRAHIQLSA